MSSRSECLWYGGYREHEGELNELGHVMHGSLFDDPEPPSRTDLCRLALEDDGIPCSDPFVDPIVSDERLGELKARAEAGQNIRHKPRKPFGSRFKKREKRPR